MKNLPKDYTKIDWKKIEIEDIYDYFEELSDLDQQAEWLIFTMENFPTLDIDYLSFINDMADDLLSRHKVAVLEKLADTFRQKFSEVYSKEYPYTEDKLIHYYFFTNQINKVLERLEIVKANPVSDIAFTVEYLYLLIYHQYYKEAVEYAQSLWQVLFDSDDVYVDGLAPFTFVLYLNTLENIYIDFKNGKNIDWDAFKHTVDELKIDETNEILNLIQQSIENEFDAQTFHGFVKLRNHRKAHVMNSIFFMKFMKDKYDISFIHSDLFFNILASSDLHKGKKPYKEYYAYKFDELDTLYGKKIDKWSFSNSLEVFGRLYGLKYVYIYLQEMDLISEEAYLMTQENINALCYIYLFEPDHENWKYAFVSHWPGIPDSNADMEKSLKSSFGIDYLSADIFEQSELFAYMKDCYKTLPARLKNKLRSPEENMEEMRKHYELASEDFPFEDLLNEDSMVRSYGLYDGLFDKGDIDDGFMEDNQPYRNLYHDQQPFLKPDEPGRNDPCPCGSGKKYKKCCMNG